MRTEARRALRIAALVLLALAAGLDAPNAVAEPAPTGACDGPRCAWSVPGAPNLLSDARWTAEASEVAPFAFAPDGITLRVENATRGGTFWLVSRELPAFDAGALSVRLRAAGDLGRFALLVRERGPGGESDSTFFYPPVAEETLATFPWARVRADAETVRVFLRAEIAPGASATAAFSEAYFGADGTQWREPGAAAPFAFGPRAETRASRPGPVQVVVEDGSGAVIAEAIAPASPPVAAFVAGPSPDLPGAIRLDARGSTSVWHPELVRNGAFDEGLAGWKLAPHELGPQTTALVDDGRLRLANEAPSANASAWATQRVAVVPHRWHLFTWEEPLDPRGGATAAPVIVEPDGTRHEFPPAAGASRDRARALSFVPEHAEVEIQLRAIYRAGWPGATSFDAVSLREALPFEWAIEGVGTLDGILLDAPAKAAGANLTLTAVDRFGSPSVVSDRLDPALVELPTLRLRDEPLVAIAGREITLDALPTLAEHDRFRARDATGTWTLEDAEARGRFRFSVEDGVLRVESAAASVGAGAGVERDVRVAASAHDYSLAVRYRTIGSVDSVHALVRNGGRETVVDAPPSTEWRAFAMRVPASSLPTSLATVSLRAAFAPNATGALEVSEVILAPRATFRWTIAGAPGEGELSRVGTPAPGAVPWTLEVETLGGARAVRGGEIGIVAPFTPFPTLRGSIAARWSALSFPQQVSIEIANAEGRALAGAPASDGYLELADFAPGEHVLFARSPGGQRLEIGRATFAGAASVAPAPGEWTGARGADVEFRFPLANPDVVSARLHVEGRLRSFEVPLEEREPGTWIATWRAPVGAPPGTYSLALALADETGTEARIDQGRLVLAPAPGDPTGIAWVVAAVVAAALLVWLPARGRWKS